MTQSPGEWWWSRPHGHPVQIQDVRELWGSTSIQVSTGDGGIAALTPEDLRPLEEVSPEAADRNRLVHRCAGARLDDHLQRPDTVTAPLTPTLEPLPHQLQHLQEALNRDVTRLLIADEVGLGKTITAGFVLSELRNRGEVDRVLVLTPAGLIAQWVQELKRHFRIELTPVFSDLLPTPESGQVWTRFDQVIASYDSVKPMESRRGWSQEKLQAYNANRFEALIEAPWDMVIIDEAHRMAGATPGVARHALASQLSTVAPHLLLLTGTPHQGKLDQFHRLVELLDPDTFSTPETVTQENLEPYLLRTDKKHAVTLDGEPLFVERATHLTVIPESERSELHQQLYTEVTEYIRSGYAAAEKDTRSGIGFLMVLVQRLLASSTEALDKTLVRRLVTLKAQELGEEPEEDVSLEEFTDPDEDLHEEALEARSFDAQAEIEAVQRLLTLIQKCQDEGPDPKATHLLKLLRRLQQVERDPNAKVLIFTKFHPTQDMLAEFLELHGYDVATLNGSMGLDERVEAQRAFKEDAQILVSTEAGGEGLNLQFCHLVINYDLPWNPMRIEQRIGRVHRIGQDDPVSAFNVVLGGTVEHRVVEILDQKLERIMEQLGVDKLSDVLDTPTIDSEVQELYRDAVETDPDTLERLVDEQVEAIRRKALQAQQSAPEETSPLDLEEIRDRLSEPVEYWLEQFAGSAQDLLQPDLREARTRVAIGEIRPWAPGEAIPEVVLEDLPASIQGTWSLWRVGLRDGTGQVTTRYKPVLETQAGDFLAPSAKRAWEEMIAGRVEITASMSGDDSKDLLAEARDAAERACESTYRALVKEHELQLEEERRRHQSSVDARRSAIQNIGLPEVRSHRLNRLEREDEQWREDHERRGRVHPVLEPILLAEIRGERD